MDWTWLVTTASIVGAVANIYKRRWGFAVWLCANVVRRNNRSGTIFWYT